MGLPYCGGNGIGVVCYSPMAKGLLTGAFSAERVAGLEESDYRRKDPMFQSPWLERNLRVVDIGLLCNARLAQEGYAGYESYLMDEVNPEVIEARHHWIKAGGREESQRFVDNYQVVFVNGIRLFVRKDLVRAMEPGRLRTGEFDADGRSPAYDESHLMYLDHAERDFKLNARFGGFVVLGADG